MKGARLAALLLRVLMRDGQLVFWNFIFFPVLLVLMMAFLSGGDVSVRMTLTAALVAVGIMANALFSAGVSVAAARERGIYRLYAGASGILGRLLATGVAMRALVIAAAAALELTIAMAVFRVPSVSIVEIATFTVVGTASFASLGLAIAAVAGSTRAANRGANLFLLPMMVFGTSLPSALLPSWWLSAREWLPVAAIQDGILAGLTGSDPPAVQAKRIAVLLVWAGASLIAAGLAWPDARPWRPRGGGRLRTARGFAATESAAVIASMAVLVGTAGPRVQEYIQTAKTTKAHGDVRVIAVSFIRLFNDVGSLRSAKALPGAALLVSDGKVPQTETPATTPWSDTATPAVQPIASHLVDNAAGYSTGQYAQWRGPYVEGLGADPWGARYGVNVQLLNGNTPGIAVVLSAGPNGIVETPFRLEKLPLDGDDVIAMVGVTR